MGAIPPLNEAEWNKAFDSYKQIAQYKYLNSHFSLHDFKFIFYWEWSHRLWARMLGVVFAIGFVYFLIRKYFDKGMIRPFIILFILGGIQGFVGWKMVASGLNDTELYVKHTWLAAHFLSAVTLMCYTFWFALLLLIPEDRRRNVTGMARAAVGLIVVLYVQLAYGAFMAGLHAGKSAPTWPKINGDWIPEGMGARSFISHPINVQFIHRALAYLIIMLIGWWFYKATRYARAHGHTLLTKTARWAMALVALQVLLGIVTVLSAPLIVFARFGTYELLAEVHQLVGMFLVLSMVANLFAVTSFTGKSAS